MRSEAARRTALLAMPLVVLAAACLPSERGHEGGDDATDVDAGDATAAQPIIDGSPDADHPAVVWLFSPEEGTSCTGTIISVNGTTGYVLTAAHCANMGVVGVTTDYLDCFAQPPAADCNALFTVDEQVYHPDWTGDVSGEGNDFSLIRFLGASPATPVIPAAESGDGVAPNVDIDIVGFGQTEADDNTRRNHKVTAVSEVSGPLFSHVRTVCFGDSGGPALLDGHVVGVSSFVDSDTCDGRGYSGRVQQVYDDFIAPYIEQDPIVPTCEQCLDVAVNTLGGPCGGALDACHDDAECRAIEACRAECVGNPGCESDCILGHPAGAALYDDIFRCVSCDVCVPSCGEDARCAEPPPTATVASSSTGLPVEGATSSAGAGGEGGGTQDDVDADDDGCAVATPGAGSPRTALGLVALTFTALAAGLGRRRRERPRPATR